MHGTQLMSGGDKSTPPETSRSGRRATASAALLQLLVFSQLVHALGAANVAALSRWSVFKEYALARYIATFFLLPLAWTQLSDRNRSTRKGPL